MDDFIGAGLGTGLTRIITGKWSTIGSASIGATVSVGKRLLKVDADLGKRIIKAQQYADQYNDTRDDCNKLRP